MEATSRAHPRPDAVLGLGNEIARDDGVGIAVAREVERQLAGRQEVEVVALPWAGLALLDELTGRRRVAVVDCLVSQEHPPGTVVRLEEGEVRGSVRRVSCHDLDFPTVLALGHRLGWPMPEVVAVWGVEAACAEELGEGLSAPVAAAVPRVVAEVLEFLRSPPSFPDHTSRLCP
jgi:hydrogenase maturation protease